MYVTRPLSVYRSSPPLISAREAEAEGPNSGILIIQDEDSESRCCFGLFKDTSFGNLPFPQNKNLQLYYNMSAGDAQYIDYFYGLLIPVINHPLSSNRYYVIKSRGKQTGHAITSSKEDDMRGCCFCKYAKDIKPQPFDRNNAYQQFEVCIHTSCGEPNGFCAKSVAEDGIPPKFLGWKGWEVATKTIKNLNLTEANGLDAALRARLPDIKSSSPAASAPVVVGKWYCPFIFIREGSFDTQIKKTMYYEMTLQQNWEQIFDCLNYGEVNNSVVEVDVSVQKQVVLAGGSVAGAQSVNVADDVMWVSPLNVGLSMAIVERVKWEQERAGFKWVDWGNFGEKERVRRTEEFKGKNAEWRKFGCYVLVETFVLKRMDGSLVLTWDFKHTHQIATKWD